VGEESIIREETIMEFNITERTDIGRGYVLKIFNGTCVTVIDISPQDLKKLKAIIGELV